MSETPEMVLRVMRASFDHWRANADRLGAHMDKGRTIEDMTENELRFAESHARAVIEAMRVSTQEMCEASRVADWDIIASSMPACAADIWTIMIDSALGK